MSNEIFVAEKQRPNRIVCPKSIIKRKFHLVNYLNSVSSIDECSLNCNSSALCLCVCGCARFHLYFVFCNLMRIITLWARARETSREREQLPAVVRLQSVHFKFDKLVLWRIKSKVIC